MSQIKEFIEYILNSLKFWIIINPWESAIRVRFGKNVKLMKSGFFFRIPHFDNFYIQESRLRVCSMPLQTLTSLDNKTITINSAIGYEIEDIKKMYNTVYHPETTITNISMSILSDYIYRNEIKHVSPEKIEKHLIEKLSDFDYGIKYVYFKITNFAVVRTYRLIQDQSWVSEGLEMDQYK